MFGGIGIFGIFVSTDQVFIPFGLLRAPEKNAAKVLAISGFLAENSHPNAVEQVDEFFAIFDIVKLGARIFERFQESNARLQFDTHDAEKN